MNQGNLAQHLSLGDGFVVLGKRVASCDPTRVVLLDETMQEEAARPHHQYNVAWNNLLGSFVFNANNIPRPDRRQHAGSPCLQAYYPSGGKNFGCKLKLMTLVSLW